MSRRMGLSSTTAARVCKTTSAESRLHCSRWQRCSGTTGADGGCGIPTESGLLISACEVAIALAFGLGGRCSSLIALGQRQHERWPASRDRRLGLAVHRLSQYAGLLAKFTQWHPRRCLVSLARVHRRLWKKRCRILSATLLADRSRLNGRLQERVGKNRRT